VRQIKTSGGKTLTTNGHKVNWERVPEQGAPPDYAQWCTTSPGTALPDDYQAAIDLALEKGDMIRAAETQFGNAKIKQRHEGIRHRVNPDDRRRIVAQKSNHDRKVLSGDHLNELGHLAAAGLEFVMDYVEYQEKRNAVRPASVQPLGNALKKATVQILTGTLIEQLKLNAEMGNQEIARATPLKQHQE
jgi:hypothetical protein